MEFTGVITHIGEEEVFGENFAKVSVRLQEVTDKQYPASMLVDFSNKLLSEVEKLKEGDVVTVGLNFRTNESKKEAGKFFNSISVWKVKKENTEQNLDEIF